MNLFEMPRTPRGDMIPVMGVKLTSHIDYLPTDQADRRMLGLVVMNESLKLIKADDVKDGVYVWNSLSVCENVILHIRSFLTPENPDFATGSPSVTMAVVYIATVDENLLIATVDDLTKHGTIIEAVCEANGVVNIKELLDKHREMCNDLIIADNNRPKVLERIEALKSAQLPSEEVQKLMNKHLPK